MLPKASYFFLLVGCLLPNIFISEGQQLSLVQTSARFPRNVSSAVSIYDGDDSIYIFGGQASYQNDDIFRYSISADTLTLEGTLAVIEYGGSAVMDNTGQIFYFIRTQVYKFYPGTLHLVTQVATLSSDITYTNAVKYNPTSSKVYFIGQSSSKIPCFDISTLAMCEEKVQTEIHGASTSVFFKGAAYVFQPPSFYLWPFPQRVRRIDLDTFELTYGPLTFPFIVSRPGAAVVGDYIYLVGGHNSTAGLGIPTNGIIQFHPESNKPTFLPVDNFMIDEHQLMMHCSVEYVEKLDRLYIFGGLSRDKVEQYDKKNHNEVWYIDLSPLRNVQNNTSLM